jgi:hypothetical protein
MSMISPDPFRLILRDFQARRDFYELHKTDEDPVLICLNNNNLFLKLSMSEFDEVLELFEVSSHMLEVNELMTSE